MQSDAWKEHMGRCARCFWKSKQAGHNPIESHLVPWHMECTAPWRRWRSSRSSLPTYPHLPSKLTLWWLDNYDQHMSWMKWKQNRQDCSRRSSNLANPAQSDSAPPVTYSSAEIVGPPISSSTALITCIQSMVPLHSRDYILYIWASYINCIIIVLHIGKTYLNVDSPGSDKYVDMSNITK